MLELSLESYSKLTDGIEAKLDEADFVAENERFLSCNRLLE